MARDVRWTPLSYLGEQDHADDLDLVLLLHIHSQIQDK